MVNATGANGTDNGVFPPDEELREILFDFERKSLSRELRLRYLEEKHHIKIGLTKLKALNLKFHVPSSRKFQAVEEATEAIAESSLETSIRGKDRTPDSSAKDHLTCAARAVARVQKSAPHSNAIGIFQEIHIDGHEKLGEKALRMGTGIGIDVLLLKAVPNSRLSDTVGHLFLDMVSDFQATSVQVTFDGGSELGWLAAFQTTLREVFAPELSADEWRPVVAVKSTSNISIESTWSYDRHLTDGPSGQSLKKAVFISFREICCTGMFFPSESENPVLKLYLEASFAGSGPR
ncbi:hypothetical protein B0H10DRAFT_1942105 [Mycena sp. CBHHK59/15]|nr:hypothetical protein B0H10DRAFT_1942105 [Mycena sp. CBHHK59/15]